MRAYKWKEYGCAQLSVGQKELANQGIRLRRKTLGNSIDFFLI